MNRIITRGIGSIDVECVVDSSHLMTRGYGLSVIEVGEIIVVQSFVALIKVLVSLVTLSVNVQSDVSQNVDKESIVADELGVCD